MPEAAVYKHCKLGRSNYDIRTSGDFGDRTTVNPVPNTTFVQFSPEIDLASSVPLTLGLHSKCGRRVRRLRCALPPLHVVITIPFQLSVMLPCRVFLASEHAAFSAFP